LWAGSVEIISTLELFFAIKVAKLEEVVVLPTLKSSKESS